MPRAPPPLCTPSGSGAGRGSYWTTARPTGRGGEAVRLRREGLGLSVGGSGGGMRRHVATDRSRNASGGRCGHGVPGRISLTTAPQLIKGSAGDARPEGRAARPRRVPPGPADRRGRRRRGGRLHSDDRGASRYEAAAGRTRIRNRVRAPVRGKPCCFSVHAAQATHLALDAIADSAGSRAQVLEKLFEARGRGRLRRKLRDRSVRGHHAQHDRRLPDRGRPPALPDRDHASRRATRARGNLRRALPAFTGTHPAVIPRCRTVSTDPGRTGRPHRRRRHAST